MSKRSKLLIEITQLEVEINNLDVMKAKSDPSSKSAYTDQLHEKRRDLNIAYQRLKADDEAWISDQEQKIMVLESQLGQCSPGRRAILEDEIQEYKNRVATRKEKMEKYGSRV